MILPLLIAVVSSHTQHSLALSTPALGALFSVSQAHAPSYQIDLIIDVPSFWKSPPSTSSLPWGSLATVSSPPLLIFILYHMSRHSAHTAWDWVLVGVAVCVVLAPLLAEFQEGRDHMCSVYIYSQDLAQRTCSINPC